MQPAGNEGPGVRGEGFGRRLPAGVVDSAFASLATFIVGLTAVNLFDDVSRGVYAVYFTAFMAGTMLPRQLIFTPAEVQAVAYSVPQRLSVIPASIRLGIGPALVGTVASGIAWLVTRSYADPDVNTALLVTCAVAIVLSPIQDHVRKMFHIATVSWRAAGVSIVQFLAVCVAVGIAIAVDVPVAWVPFGALTIANALSLAVARVVTHFSIDERLPEALRFVRLARQGTWLVVHAAAPSVSGFIVAAVVAELAGPEALGFAESARVVAQPVLVLSAGLTAVLAPRSVRAAMDLDRGTARHTNRAYLGIMAVAGVAYLAVAGWDWVLNPLAYLVPSAYVVAGLAAVTIVANTVRSAVFLQVNELMGAHRERRLALIGWLEAPVRIGVAFTAGATEAFARPLALTAGSGTRLVLQSRALAGVYDERSEAGAGRSATDDE